MALTNRLKHVKAIKTLTEVPEWIEVENTMRAMIKQKRVARDNLNWEDDDEKFLAFKERASFMTGFIQGAEWMLNDVVAALNEQESLEAQIKTVEDEIKEGRARG